jgi:hypothetical protein
MMKAMPLLPHVPPPPPRRMACRTWRWAVLHSSSGAVRGDDCAESLSLEYTMAVSSVQTAKIRTASEPHFMTWNLR